LCLQPLTLDKLLITEKVIEKAGTELVICRSIFCDNGTGRAVPLANHSNVKINIFTNIKFIKFYGHGDGGGVKETNPTILVSTEIRGLHSVMYSIPSPVVQ
jgi:hypothetical protein